MLRSLVMRHRFDQPAVEVKRPLDQLFAVPGDRAAGDGDIRTQDVVDVRQLLVHNVDRIPVIAAVMRMQKLALRRDEHEFRGRAPAVDSQIRRTRIGIQRAMQDIRSIVTFEKRVVFLRACEKRIVPHFIVLLRRRLLQMVHPLPVLKRPTLFACV